MGHDAFAHHALGSAALMIISALYARTGQTLTDLICSSSVSRATTYRTLQRLARHGLVQHHGETWTLTHHALHGIDHSPTASRTAPGLPAAQSWDEIAQQSGTAGTAARRKALHADQRAAYRQTLERLAEHRSHAVVIVHDGRQLLVPAVRADEIPPVRQAPDGQVLDPATGRPAEEWRVATDGRLILITPADQRSYDELAAAHARGRAAQPGDVACAVRGRCHGAGARGHQRPAVWHGPEPAACGRNGDADVVAAPLPKVAQAHSEDMALHQNMSHSGSDGSSPGDRITSAGYTWSAYGENVAYGYASPEQVMAAWMASPGHKANILNCTFKEIGVGLARPNDYWTQDFATTR
ncbi:CAP domain-containing protein [Streptomyces sp. NPDC059627]